MEPDAASAPTFYLSLGRSPRRRDITVARLCGQRDFLIVPMSGPVRWLQQHDPQLADASFVLDSAAYPIGNRYRPTREQFYAIARYWQRALGHRLHFVFGYDHIADGGRSQRDQDWLEAQDWRADAPPIRVWHYPTASAHDLVGGFCDTVLDMLTEEEFDDYRLHRDFGLYDGPADYPVAAIGGLVVARYCREAHAWYRRLLEDLEHEAGREVDRFNKRFHLLGIASPQWIHHPYVFSFDSSGPFRNAALGAAAVMRRFHEEFGLSPAKLLRSREARLAHEILRYRWQAGLPTTAVEESLFLDDGQRLSQRSSSSLSPQQQTLW